MTIELTENETEPSENYTSNTFPTRAFEGIIQVEFNQKIGLDGLTSANKPRVRISINE